MYARLCVLFFFLHMCTSTNKCSLRKKTINARVLLSGERENYRMYILRVMYTRTLNPRIRPPPTPRDAAAIRFRLMTLYYVVRNEEKIIYFASLFKQYDARYCIRIHARTSP